MPANPTTLNTDNTLGIAATWSEIIRVSLPVAASYVPLGGAKSLIMLGIGLDWYWPIITPFIVYAGALEYLLVGFIIAPLTLPMVIWTSFLVNFRHLLYGLSYPSQRLQNSWQKFYAAYALTDEAYILISIGDGKDFNAQSLIRLQGLLQFWWWLGGALGVGLFYLLPVTLQGFEFGLTAMFIILSIDSVRKMPQKRTLVFTLIACLLGLWADYFWEQTFLIIGLGTFVLILSLDFIVQQRKRTL